MKRFLQRIASVLRSVPRPAAGPRRRARLTLETLESRELLSTMTIGMNLERVTDYMAAWMFTDAFKASRPWIPDARQPGHPHAHHQHERGRPDSQRPRLAAGLQRPELRRSGLAPRCRLLPVPPALPPATRPVHDAPLHAGPGDHHLAGPALVGP